MIYIEERLAAMATKIETETEMRERMKGKPDRDTFVSSRSRRARAGNAAAALRHKIGEVAFSAIPTLDGTIIGKAMTQGKSYPLCVIEWGDIESKEINVLTANFDVLCEQWYQQRVERSGLRLLLNRLARVKTTLEKMENYDAKMSALSALDIVKRRAVESFLGEVL